MNLTIILCHFKLDNVIAVCELFDKNPTSIQRHGSSTHLSCLVTRMIRDDLVSKHARS